MAAKGVLDISMGRSGLFIPSPVTTRSTQGAARIEVTKEFVVELKDGLTFADRLIALLDECLRSVAAHGGTAVRRGGGAASVGATYESLGCTGKIEIQAFKDPKGVRLRLRAYEERT